MASVSLMLKDTKTKGKTRIIAKLTDGRNVQIRISTGHSIYPKHWSKKNKNVLSADSNATAINKDLKFLQNRILEIYTTAKSEDLQPDLNYIQEQLEPSTPTNTNKEFWTVYSYYLESKRRDFTKNTVVKFNALKTHLIQFENERKIPLELDKITIRTMDELQEYFYEIAELNNQTTAKYLGTFKMFLNWAVRDKHTDNTDFREFKIKQQPDTTKAVFTEADMDKLKGFKDSNKKHLENVRDLLLISCLTGLRYSDYTSIKPVHLINHQGNYHLRLLQKKTNEYVEIPLNDEALTLINKFIDGSIHAISNQKMNAYAKELCKQVGIDEDFEKIQFKGNIKIAKVVPKYDAITTHTGRRTFATNLLQKGIPAEVVMKFTGHKDYNSFNKYVNIPRQAEMDMVRKALG